MLEQPLTQNLDHSSSATNFILPSLPSLGEAGAELEAPRGPSAVLQGLEESQGALYEIGVADDGVLVGLAEDEMQESLNNLRVMAVCLGCAVDVLRMETVGKCQWLDDSASDDEQRLILRSGRLLVAEAFVKPHLPAMSPPVGAQRNDSHALPSAVGEPSGPSTEQLRVTLTGPTMSGKSSLLGTLTTSTLDNGRGKSRLSMLKHRHEISSGLTSSVTQELFGYRETAEGALDVINYATENVASWIDIHNAAVGNRMVFISDSAGHPRYRRTTVRGLVGWAPHWTLLCVPADDTEDSTGRTGSTSGSQHLMEAMVSDVDLSSAQLDLCLRLRLPLIVVISKIDLATRTGLKGTLSKILDKLKAADRKPAIMPASSTVVDESDLQTVNAAGIEKAYHASIPLLNDALNTVPIVLTSAVQGTGIGDLHALLHELPFPDAKDRRLGTSSITFHIEDIYTRAAEAASVIVSGHLCSGRLTVGDVLYVGPFSTSDSTDDSEDSDRAPRRPPAHLPTSRSFPGALRDTHLGPSLYNLSSQEWRRVRVTGVRNLRLPVSTLLPDQVGTIAIEPEKPSQSDSTLLARVRKGMVLSTAQPLAARSFSARVKREDLEALAVGNHVVIYSASVRASAKVVSARAPDSPIATRSDDEEHDRNSRGHDPFNFEDVAETLDGTGPKIAGMVTAPFLVVTFRFDAAKEYVIAGDRVLVMPGGGPGLYGGHERGEKGMAGLEGFVGEITESMG